MFLSMSGYEVISFLIYKTCVQTSVVKAKFIHIENFCCIFSSGWYFAFCMPLMKRHHYLWAENKVPIPHKYSISSESLIFNVSWKWKKKTKKKKKHYNEQDHLESLGLLSVNQKGPLISDHFWSSFRVQKRNGVPGEKT